MKAQKGAFVKRGISEKSSFESFEFFSTVKRSDTNKLKIVVTFV